MMGRGVPPKGCWESPDDVIVGAQVHNKPLVFLEIHQLARSNSQRDASDVLLAAVEQPRGTRSAIGLQPAPMLPPQVCPRPPVRTLR